MKMFIIGIFDRKAQLFVEMSATANLAVATRGFSEAVNKPSESPVHKWPDDYSLWHMGYWDSETGKPDYFKNDEGDYERQLVVEASSLKSH